MKVRAPGKVLLTGAYAVLEGAPAIVFAVDRYAVADGARTTASPPAEVRAALGADAAPEIDVAELMDETGQKLGLGSSAAAVVAALGCRAWARGEDPRQPLVRTRLFRAARAAHALVQRGGSGVDVAASVHGGALRYSTSAEGVLLRAIEPPSGLHVNVYFSGRSARTSDLRARVDGLKARDPKARVFAELRACAERAAEGLPSAREFVSAAQRFGNALESLGNAADAPIVTPSCRDLARAAAEEDAAFFPSGAGGGDVAVWIGLSAPSSLFETLAQARSMRPLVLQIDRGGVRPESAS